MKNVKLIIEYDGFNYCGWQAQKNGIAVQQIIADALLTITGEKCNLNGSGRTDAKVHAKGQAANFLTNSNIPGEKFAFRLNAILPPDIVIKKSEEVDLDFHASFSAKGKKYSYLIYNSLFPSAIMRNYAYCINFKEKLDLEKMRKAADMLEGTHDFRAFMGISSIKENTVRTIFSIEIIEKGEYITINFIGNGFLYNMVRILTGTLIYAAVGRIKLEEIPLIIEGKDRRKAGITAPAYGLYLEEVYY